MNKEWRPQDWEGDGLNMACGETLAQDCHHRDDEDHNDCCTFCEKVFETGASAMFKALIKWLFEPCTEHPISNGKEIDFTIMFEPVYLKGLFYRHHKDCPQCMEQLKGE
jgi:hypothetical protein